MTNCLEKSVPEFLASDGPITPEMLDRLEVEMLKLPQIDVDVTHHLQAGLYVREGILPAGGIYLGHFHREEHLCVVLSGRMLLIHFDRSQTEICGPQAFWGKPGRKLVIVTHDVLMQNIHSTADWPDECFYDLDAREEWLYAITPAARAHRQKKSIPEKLFA